MKRWALQAEQAFIVQMYSLLAFGSLGVFGAAHIFGHTQPHVGYIELAGSGIFLLNALLARYLKAVRLACTIFLLTVLAYLMVMLVSGGMHNTGIFWFFVFPVSAFFLAGKRPGVWWMAALLAVSGVVWLLGAHETFTLAYDNITIRQLLISVLVVTIGIYVYQRSLEGWADKDQQKGRELKSERIRADEIVEYIDEGIITTDRDGKITFMNPAAEQMLGWRIADLEGKQLVTAVPMLDQRGAAVAPDSRPLVRSLRNGKSTSMVAIYQGRTGKKLPVSVTSRAIVSDSQIVGAIDTFRDISEERRVVRAKSEFVTLASHQLRTPISAISWISELLLSGDAGRLTAEQHEYVEDIYQSNRRMASLIKEMLIESSLEVGDLPVVPQKVILSKLSAAIVHEQRAAHKDKQPVIAEHYDADIPPLLCDPDIVRLILSNLLSNAIKYSPVPAHIDLSIRPSSHEKVTPASQGSVVITVSDQGYGIPRDATDKIFTKFFRATNVIRKDTDGTGLGLQIVKAVLDYVGGSISFTSQEDKGSTFTVLLPLEGMIKHIPRTPQPDTATAKKSMRKRKTN